MANEINIGKKITTKEEAIFRLACEVILFTDRPDYTRPKSVREAFDVLFSKEEKTQIYRSYGNWEEYDEEDEEDGQ